ncbi:MAG: diacylglycerol kinase family protein [Thermoanaerobaculaceae bacterium]|nr:diacylglycerol kinase family protein [Thermoanaerobaculaceae bacterium]
MTGARLSVIINASSGAPKISGLSADLADRFKSAGFEPDIRLVNSPEIAAEVRRAVAAKPETIVIGGGDGTLSAAASSLIGTDTALGILPLGTLNHFAKDLHIPLDIEGAVQTIAGGQTLNVDVGAVNDRFFLNNSSLGLYPKVVAGRDALRQRLGRGKLPALIWSGLGVFRRYPFLNVRITIDDTELVRRTPFVFVGNNRYEMEGFRIGERARLDGAELSLYVANRTGRLGLLLLALRALFKRLKQSKDFDMGAAKSLQVETRHDRLRVANDGELCYMRTPLEYRLLPAALSVVVPGPGATS